MIPDINYLPLKLQIERYLSIDAVNDILARATFIHPDLSKSDDYLTAINYTPFENAILTQSLLVDHSPRIIVVLDDNHIGNSNNTEQYDYSTNWPGNIYVCQMMDKKIFGVSFVMLPGFNSNKR